MVNKRIIILSLILAMILVIPANADDEIASAGPSETASIDIEDTEPTEENVMNEEGEDGEKEESEQEELITEQENTESDTDSEHSTSTGPNAEAQQPEDQAEFTEERPDCPMIRPASWTAVFEDICH